MSLSTMNGGGERGFFGGSEAHCLPEASAVLTSSSWTHFPKEMWGKGLKIVATESITLWPPLTMAEQRAKQTGDAQGIH